MALKTTKTVLVSTKGKRSASANPERNRTDSLRPKKKKNSRKAKKRLASAGITLLILAGLYCIAVFSNIPFVAKWRDIYISTAMDTMNHKWLATYFIPASVIEKTMSGEQTIIDQQQSLHSSWADESSSSKGSLLDADNQTAFFELFDELDQDSFKKYADQHPDILKNGYRHLLINKAGLKDSGTSIKTKQGDQVVAIDSENSLLIIKVTGDGYVGKMAIVKDPSLVKVGVASSLGSSGQSVGQIADHNDAVLAINASGFADYQATGNGGSVVGLLIANGKQYNKGVTGTYLNIGFDQNDRLYIGVSASKIKYRDAVQFLPALIVNGDNVISDKTFTKGAMGFGIQPRTAIGQAKDGTVLLLTVDGRKVGYSLGCGVTDLADIFMRYDAVQASNLDGGSSTVMVYRGKPITDPADNTDYGRLVPDAFIVSYAEGATRPKNVSSGGTGKASVQSDNQAPANSPASSASSSPSASPTDSKPSDSGATESPTSASPDASSNPDSSASPDNSASPSPETSAESSPSPSATEPTPSASAPTSDGTTDNSVTPLAPDNG